MSLEAKIEALTAAINCLAAAVSGGKGNALIPSQTVQSAPTVAPQPIIPTPTTAAPTPMVPPAAIAAAPVAAAMPPLPTFIPPTPPPVVETAAPRAPFTDAKGLVAYTMESYKNMGQQKGALIQNVLVECGTKNINELSPDKYTQFYLGVEALKAST